MCVPAFVFSCVCVLSHTGAFILGILMCVCVSVCVSALRSQIDPFFLFCLKLFEIACRKKKGVSPTVDRLGPHPQFGALCWHRETASSAPLRLDRHFFRWKQSQEEIQGLKVRVAGSSDQPGFGSEGIMGIPSFWDTDTTCCWFTVCCKKKKHGMLHEHRSSRGMQGGSLSHVKNWPQLLIFVVQRFL